MEEPCRTINCYYTEESFFFPNFKLNAENYIPRIAFELDH